jgi:hypothetical protein
MTRIIGAIVLASLALAASEADANELLGKVVPAFPYGIFEDGGTCTGDDGPDMCRRAVIILKTSDGRDFLIFSGSKESMMGKKPRWRVVDAIAFPAIPANRELVWTDCRKSGAPDASVIALVRSDPKREWLRARDWAYRVDDTTGKFVKLDPKDVDCANPALDDED